jgi:hypothetical protein
MKNLTKQLFTALAVIGITIALVSCGSSKKTKTPPNEVDVVMYCTGPDYQSNAKALRYSAIGTSMDQMTSKKKAENDARAGLAAQLNTKVKSVIDRYRKSSGHQNNEDLTDRYEGLTREVINQNLAGTRSICEKMTKTTDGNYKTYICMELSGDEILNSLNNKMSKDEQLKADYDYEKFKKTFEEEMSKVEGN